MAKTFKVKTPLDAEIEFDDIEITQTETFEKQKRLTIGTIRLRIEGYNDQIAAFEKMILDDQALLATLTTEALKVTNAINKPK